MNNCDDLLRLLSWRMMADSVLLVTHSSSLPIPSGTVLWHRCRGSMHLLTRGMTPSYISATEPADRQRLVQLTAFKLLVHSSALMQLLNIPVQLKQALHKWYDFPLQPRRFSKDSGSLTSHNYGNLISVDLNFILVVEVPTVQIRAIQYCTIQS